MTVMQREEERSQVLRGYGVLAQCCSAALVTEPNEAILCDLARVAAALGDDRFAGIEPSDALRQRFYDRFIVSCTPYFVPLAENAVTKRWEAEGVLHYGSLASAKGDHVLRCYKAVGFDARALTGCEAVVGHLHPDAMAVELAFMGELAHAAADQLAAGGESSAERLLVEFARLHARWFADGAACLAASDDDLYARVAALAAQNTESLVESLVETLR